MIGIVGPNVSSHIILCPCHLVAVLDQRLAALARQQRGQLLGALADLVGDLVEQMGFVVRRNLAPALKRLVCRRHRRPRILLAAQRHLGDLLLGGRIVDRKSLARHTWHALAVDQHQLGHTSHPLQTMNDER
jgi:hypothetical protein